MTIGAQMTALDIDNDGRDDLAIASTNDSYLNIITDTTLFYGELPEYNDGNGASRTCRSNDAHATFNSTNQGVANAGDQNNDGFEDLLVKGQGLSDGNIYLFYGADNGP